jgi:hypothetical protein
MLILLVLPFAAALGVWASMLAWRGNWQGAALALGIPFLIAVLVAVLAFTGALNSGHSEDWGPLMAMLAAAALGGFCVIAAIVAGIVGYLGHRRRAASLGNTF